MEVLGSSSAIAAVGTLLVQRLQNDAKPSFVFHIEQTVYVRLQV